MGLRHEVSRDMIGILLALRRRDRESLFALGSNYDEDPERLAILCEDLLHTLYTLMEELAAREDADMGAVLERMALRYAQM